MHPLHFDDTFTFRSKYSFFNGTVFDTILQKIKIVSGIGILRERNHEGLLSLIWISSVYSEGFRLKANI